MLDASRRLNEWADIVGHDDSEFKDLDEVSISWTTYHLDAFMLGRGLKTSFRVEG